jgi:predicted HicB family RNase H-like nuclease
MIKTMIKYKGFIGHFFFDEKTGLFQGNVANSNDVITFQASSVAKIQQAFQEAIDEHLEWCKKHRKELEIPYS